MGKIPGKQQVNLYVEPGLYKQVKVLAASLDVNIYDLVNDALRDKVAKHVNPEEKKAMDKLVPSSASPAKGKAAPHGGFSPKQAAQKASAQQQRAGGPKRR